MTVADFLGQRVRATYVRSEGAATDRDLTGPRPRPVVGILSHLAVDDRLVLLLSEGEMWRTTKVRAIDREEETLRIVTQHSVYRLRLI